MDHQTYIDPTMLSQAHNEPEANELSFDLEELINQYTYAETYNENFEWTMIQPEMGYDMSLWGDLPSTAAQTSLPSMTSSSHSSAVIPYEEFEQLFYTSPQSHPTYPSPQLSQDDYLILDTFSPSSSETTSSQQSSEPSPQPTSSQPASPTSAFTCSFCAKPFEKRHLLNRHELQHTKPIQCPSPGCNHRTAKRRDMHRHIIVHHPNDNAVATAVPVVVPLFLCPVSGCRHAEVGFKRKDHLVRHMKRIHPGMSP